MKQKGKKKKKKKSEYAQMALKYYPLLQKMNYEDQ